MADEVELKAVIGDIDDGRRRVERAGGVLVFDGALHDHRYDTPGLGLAARDHVLRLRVKRSLGDVQVTLDWKGPTRYERGYKVREEISTAAGDPAALATILGQLGYVVIRAIERDISQYELAGSVIRFEHYPRMDDLVEVEGRPPAIESAIAVLGLSRESFTAERLRDFMRRFEERTKTRSALCAEELAGHFPYHGDA